MRIHILIKDKPGLLGPRKNY